MEYFIGTMIFIALTSYALETNSVPLAALCGFGAGAIGVFGLILTVAYFETGIWQLPSDVAERWMEYVLAGGLCGGSIGGGTALARRVPAFLRGAGGTISEIGDRVAQSQREREHAEKSVYDLIAHEIEEGRIDSSTWVRAIEKSEGNEERAKAEYIQLRRRDLLANRKFK